MIPAANHWKEQARYDLDTARAMLDAGRYLYVLFCRQQAVEKAIKAIIVEQSKQLPPRIHSLPRLAEIAKLVGSCELKDCAERDQPKVTRTPVIFRNIKGTYSSLDAPSSRPKNHPPRRREFTVNSPPATVDFQLGVSAFIPYY